MRATARISARYVIRFVIVLVLLSQVFSNLRRCGNLHVTSVEQAHFTVMVSVSLVAFVANDAIDLGSDGPELALLWCFLYHKITFSSR